ncbi:unnamed protein product [Cuscuta campestris]|uniref:Uncharacterized protein n=1 Tax=Cuscuta campestris TaxID=132261 RepID=A0A484M8J7_9ASTE|nr:unnamed protein product [Cuscuta campestris]
MSWARRATPPGLLDLGLALVSEEDMLGVSCCWSEQGIEAGQVGLRLITKGDRQTTVSKEWSVGASNIVDGRTYVKHLLSMGKTEEAIEFAQKFIPSAVQNNVTIGKELSKEGNLDHKLNLTNTSDDFNTETETAIAPVWVLLPGLPIHFFDMAALALVCKPLGKILGIDPTTMNKSRPHVARVRVEMDLMAPLIHKLFIGTSTVVGKEDEGFYQTVEYERIPYYCSRCFKQGHTAEKCKLEEENHYDAEKMRKGKHILTEEPPNQLKPTRRGRSRSRAPPSTQHQQMVYVPKTLGLNTQPSQLYEGQTSKGQNTEKNKTDPKKNDFQVVHKKQFPKQTASHSNKTSPAIENHNAKEPEPIALKQFALTPTIGLIPKPPTHEGHKHPANSQPLDVFNTFEVLQQLNMEHTGLNPKASEFHPSTIPGANTIPSKNGVPLAELDPDPKSGEDDIEELPIQGKEPPKLNPLSHLLGRNLEKPELPPLPKQLINGFHTCVECKVWIFWKDTYSIDLLTNEEQVVFVKATQLSSCRNSVIAFVYAKTKSWLRKDLWNSLVLFAQSHDNATPWAVVGDFNCSLRLEEKLGGLPMSLSASWDFQQCIMDCGLLEAEEVYQQEDSEENLLKLKAITAQYTHQLHLEEMFWKQKAHIQWIEGGDRNSKYFHSLVKDRRRKLYIHKIKGHDGHWIEDHQQISSQAIDFFQKLFSEESRGTIDYSSLACISPRITDEDNQQLVASPSLEEVKDAVFSLNPNSAAGLVILSLLNATVVLNLIENQLNMCLPKEMWLELSGIIFVTCLVNVPRLIFKVRQDAVEAVCHKWPKLSNSINDWKAIFTLSGNISKAFHFKESLWQNPPVDTVKINVSLCSDTNGHGLTAMARDSKGIFQYAYWLANQSSVLVGTIELLVIMLQWCLSAGFQLNEVDRIFEYKDVPNRDKVKLVAIKLHGRASAWWEQMWRSREKKGKPKINDWENCSLGNLLRCLAGNKAKQWDLALPQAEFAYNRSTSRTTGMSPFQVVYDWNPTGVLDLAPIPRVGRFHPRAEEMAEHLKEIHEQVRSKIEESNNRYKAQVDKHRRQVLFDVGDFVWAVLTKDRFPVGEWHIVTLTVDADLGEVSCYLDGNFDGYQTGLPLHTGSCVWEQGTEVWVGIRPPIDLDAFGRSDSEAANSKMQIMDVFLWGRCLTEDEIATLPGAIVTAEYNMINLLDHNFQWTDSPTRASVLCPKIVDDWESDPADVDLYDRDDVDWDGQYSSGRRRRSERDSVVVLDVDLFTRRLRKPSLET